MPTHPIESIMKTTMENIKEMIDVNTIVGDAVETGDGTVIIPISKVSFGFVAGGGEYKDNDNSRRNNADMKNEGEAQYPFAGASGSCISLVPMAFLVVGQEKIKLLPVKFNTPVDRIVEMLPQVVEDIQNLVADNKQNKSNKQNPGMNNQTQSTDL